MMKHKRTKPATKIAKALEFLRTNKKATPYAAAMHAGISPTAVYKRLKVDAAKKDGICPCCGKSLFFLNQENGGQAK